MEAILLKDISRKIFSGASVELIRHYILLARVFMCILVVLCPSFSAMVDLGVIPKAFIHHLQAGCSWTKFCIYYYDMEFLVVQSPSWLDANWNLGLSPETALPGAWSNMKARGSIFYRTLCRHQFLISTHHELSWVILFSENGAIEGWDILSLNCHSYHEMWKPDIKAPECT